MSSAVALLAAATVVLPALLGGQEAPVALDAQGPTLGGQGTATIEELGTDPRAVFASAIEVARKARAERIADAEEAYDRRASAFRSVSEALTPDARRRVELGPLREARGVLDDSQRLAELGFDREVERAVEAYGWPAVAVFSAASDAIASLRAEYEVYVAVVDVAEAAFGAETERLRSSQDAGHRDDTRLMGAHEARAIAGIEAARLTLVHSPVELAKVTKSIRDAALAAISEVETEVLAGLSHTAIMEAFRSAASAYARPKRAAIGAILETIEEEYVSDLAVAEAETRELRARASSVQEKLYGLLEAQEGAYRRAVRVADGALQDVVVRYYSKDGIHRESGFGGVRRAAASAHRNAIEAALEARREAVSREIPEIDSFLTQVQARLYRTPSGRMYGGPSVEAQEVVQAFRRYRTSRAAADAKFGEEVARAYARAQERVVAEALAVSRKNAERMRVSKRTNAVIRADTVIPDRSKRLRALEVSIRAGLRAGREAQQPGEAEPTTNERL